MPECLQLPGPVRINMVYHHPALIPHIKDCPGMCCFSLYSIVSTGKGTPCIVEFRSIYIINSLIQWFIHLQRPSILSFSLHEDNIVRKGTPEVSSPEGRIEAKIVFV